jgi:hypothetical protein
MDLLNGHANPTPKDLQDQIFVFYPMGPCAVQQIIPFILKNEDLSAMDL